MTILEKINKIISEKSLKLTPNNIKENITIFGVNGNLEEGIDTSDATATAEDIQDGKTAYVDDQKILGTSTKVYLNNQEKFGNFATINQEISKDENFTGLSKVTVGKVTSNIDSDIKSSNIKSGVNILGVIGSLEKNDQIYLQEAEPASKTGLWIKPTEPITYFNEQKQFAYYNQYIFTNFIINSGSNQYFVRVSYNTVTVNTLNQDGTLTQVSRTSYEHATNDYSTASKITSGSATYYDGYFTIYGYYFTSGSSSRYTGQIEIAPVIVNNIAYFCGYKWHSEISSSYKNKLIALTIDQNGNSSVSVKLNSVGFYSTDCVLGRIGTKIYYCAKLNESDSNRVIICYDTSSNTLTNLGISITDSFNEFGYLAVISNTKIMILNESDYYKANHYIVDLSAKTITVTSKIIIDGEYLEYEGRSGNLPAGRYIVNNMGFYRDNKVYWYLRKGSNKMIFFCYDINSNSWELIKEDPNFALNIQSYEDFETSLKLYGITRDMENQINKFGYYQLEPLQSYSSTSANYNLIDIGNNVRMNINDIYQYEDGKIKECERYYGDGTKWNKIT